MAESKTSFRERFPVLEIAVFICGAVVMVYEIIGSRIVSPHIGTSTYVWTSLIGVILAALSLGYWLGGKWADKRPDMKILASVIFLAGGAVGITILLKDVVLTYIAAMAIPLEIRSVMAALLLFAPASVLLGFVTPYAVKLKTDSLAETGRTVGRLYALSTVGSIVGTFSAGFLLIPFLGSNRTLYLVGIALIAVSVMLVPFMFKTVHVAAAAMLIVGIIASEGMSAELRRTMNMHDIDTEYSRLQVFDHKINNGRDKVRVLATDPQSVQSMMFLDREGEATEYLLFYHLVRHFKPDFAHAVIIGGAGYSFPKSYLKTYQTQTLDVVELDPAVTQIAKDYFRLAEDPRLKITHQDGRIFLNQAEDKKYDAVFLDAFGSLFNVPFQLTTLEAVRQMDRVMKDDGVVIFNLVSAINGEQSRFFQAEYNTYKKVFPHVYFFKVQPDRPDNLIQNLIIVASKRQQEAPANSPDPELARLFKLKQPDTKLASLDTSLLLTDDHAPVEYYNSFAMSNRTAGSY